MALLAVAAFAGTASASPQDVYEDYIASGSQAIVNHHSEDDLRQALADARGDAGFADFATAVSRALDRNMLGRSDPPEAVGASASSTQAVLGVLPAPRRLDETGGPPWPLLALTVMAGALVVSGVGSTLYRRLRRN